MRIRLSEQVFDSHLESVSSVCLCSRLHEPFFLSRSSFLAGACVEGTNISAACGDCVSGMRLWCLLGTVLWRTHQPACPKVSLSWHIGSFFLRALGECTFMPSVFQASWPVGRGKARCCPARGHSGAPLHLHGNLDPRLKIRTCRGFWALPLCEALERNGILEPLQELGHLELGPLSGRRFKGHPYRKHVPIIVLTAVDDCTSSVALPPLLLVDASLCWRSCRAA